MDCVVILAVLLLMGVPAVIDQPVLCGFHQPETFRFHPDFLWICPFL
jgi:hypothetical protein